MVAGIKKDVVWSNRLRAQPRRVALYGWHEPSGRPIQPLYLGHVDWYVDYSHGVRLVSNDVLVDERPRRLEDLLRDPELYRLVSTERPDQPHEPAPPR